ncbi:MAG: hypothetical protein Q8P27_02610 [Candidatus Peregrinibacteria bacterium]|nr:hypothetical protein [Candidatus Peregrinibacteria bacterium]
MSHAPAAGPQVDVAGMAPANGPLEPLTLDLIEAPQLRGIADYFEEQFPGVQVLDPNTDTSYVHPVMILSLSAASLQKRFGLVSAPDMRIRVF